MKKRVQYKDWWLTTLNGEYCATTEVRGDDGSRQRKRFRLGVHDATAARPALIAFVAEREKAGLLAVATVADIFERYMLDRERDGVQVGYIRNNWKALGPFFGRVRATAVTADLCRQYAEEKFGEGMAASTVHTQLGRLRASLNWAVNNHLLDRSPPTWNCSPSEARSRVATPEEFHRLIDAIPESAPHTRVFTWLALLTGQRRGAILELTWDRVRFETLEINFNRDEKVARLSPAYVKMKMSKGYQKGRAVQTMSPELAGILFAEFERTKKTGCKYVVSFAGQKVDSITKSFSRAAKKAGIPDITPHVLRHTVATWAASAGHGSEQIAAMLGHKDARTTREHYITRTSEQSAGVVDMIAKKAKPRLKIIGGNDDA